MRSSSRREVARLSDVNSDRIRVACLVASGFLGALAGVLYAGTQGAADPVSGVSYQLLAFAAAFLESTCIAPGRFNPLGATVASASCITRRSPIIGRISYAQENRISAQPLDQAEFFNIG